MAYQQMDYPFSMPIKMYPVCIGSIFGSIGENATALAIWQRHYMLCVSAESLLHDPNPNSHACQTVIRNGALLKCVSRSVR